MSDAHRIVAIDLRGHGESDAPMGDYPIEGHCDDVAWLASQLDVRGPVVVGHSMGGLVALDFASRFRPRAVVILECHVAAPPAVATALQPALERLETEAYQATAGAMLDMLLGKYFDAAERARMVAYARSLPQHVLSRSLRASLTYDSARAAALVRCPILYVGGSTPYADIPRFRALCPQLVTGQLVGCGHYFPLEVPDQLHPMIRRFLELALREGA
jgi:pimeloyl-ACP methyl ester carboxylesterase